MREKKIVCMLLACGHRLGPAVARHFPNFPLGSGWEALPDHRKPVAARRLRKTTTFESLARKFRKGKSRPSIWDRGPATLDLRPAAIRHQPGLLMTTAAAAV